MGVKVEAGGVTSLDDDGITNTHGIVITNIVVDSGGCLADGRRGRVVDGIQNARRTVARRVSLSPPPPPPRGRKNRNGEGPTTARARSSSSMTIVVDDDAHPR